jgi:hypothetical protein
VATYQELWHLMEKISEACYQRFFEQKQRARGRRP